MSVGKLSVVRFLGVELLFPIFQPSADGQAFHPSKDRQVFHPAEDGQAFHFSLQYIPVESAEFVKNKPI